MIYCITLLATPLACSLVSTQYAFPYLAPLISATLGHRIFGIKIVRFEDGGQINPLNALIRTLLLMLVVTAVTFDDDGRGIHERLSGSVLTRSLR